VILQCYRFFWGDTEGVIHFLLTTSVTLRCFYLSFWGMLTCCPLFLAARQAWAHDFFWGFFSGNKSFSVASKKSKQLSSLMLLFFVCANLCCSRKSSHQQKENRKEKMVVSFIAFTLFSSLAFFFLKRKQKKKVYRKNEEKNVIPKKHAYLVSVSPC